MFQESIKVSRITVSVEQLIYLFGHHPEVFLVNMVTYCDLTLVWSPNFSFKKEKLTRVLARPPRALRALLPGGGRRRGTSMKYFVLSYHLAVVQD